MHTAASFITSHALFMMRLDESLRLIDPSLPVSVPYWNYVADSTKYGPAGIGEALVFKDDYFGGVDAGLTHLVHGSLIEGALHTKAPADVQLQVNAHGFYSMVHNTNSEELVGRWNTVCGYGKTSINVGSRYNPIPGCTNLGDVDAVHSWLALDAFIEGYHGGIHFNLAGASECSLGGFPAMKAHAGDEWWAKHEVFLDRHAAALIEFWQYLGDNDQDDDAKALIVCPAGRSCEAGSTAAAEAAATADTTSFAVPDDACRCSASSIAYQDLSAMSFAKLEKIYFSEVFIQVTNSGDLLAAKGAVGDLEALPGDNGRRALQVLVETFLRPGSVSAMGTPFESPEDPIFWVIHNLFERNYDLVRLSNRPTDPASTFNWTWPVYSTESGVGHNYDDPLPVTAGGVRMEGAFGGDVGLDLAFDEHITNAMAVRLIEPSRTALKHVYDTLEWHTSDATAKTCE
jgi:hypothetical protein